MTSTIPIREDSQAREQPPKIRSVPAPFHRAQFWLPERLITSWAEHDVIVRAIIAGDGASAGEAARAHVAIVSRRAPIDGRLKNSVLHSLSSSRTGASTANLQSHPNIEVLMAAHPPQRFSLKAASEALKAHMKANPTPLSPCVDQTEDEIRDYYREAADGSVAVVRQTQGGLLRYMVTTVDGRNTNNSRVYIRNFGAFYTKHGRNCFHPKGQTSLVAPTSEILAWAKANPGGQLGFTIFRRDNG